MTQKPQGWFHSAIYSEGGFVYGRCRFKRMQLAATGIVALVLAAPNLSVAPALVHPFEGSPTL